MNRLFSKTLKFNNNKFFPTYVCSSQPCKYISSHLILKDELKNSNCCSRKCIPSAKNLLTYDAKHISTSFPKWQEAVQEKDLKEEHQFQAETKMLLDIVARSLYSDREVFLRELVSNASDALEKLRCIRIQQTEKEEIEDLPLKISITTDKYSKTLTIQDNGVGMNKEELINNLGTIARSGSKEFLKKYMKDGNDSNPQNIIGQFGVGFYSSFMVADKVEVFTKSHEEGTKGYCWSSDGSGKYTIEERDNISKGTKMICHLKTDDREFSDEETIKNVIKKYSNFVGFPIEVNDVQVNQMEPLWLKDPKQVSSEEHLGFYKFIGSAFDTPRFTLHFHTDAPVNLRCLLYFPDIRPGLLDIRDGEFGVSLYCRKVLIKTNVETLLPKWLRFVKGVVDSEDIPLNLSREMLQDSALIRKLRTVIQNRTVRFLLDKARKDPEGYNKFFTNYGIFLKEGIISAPEQVEKEEIAKLIRYETSKLPAGETLTLAEYAGKIGEDQKNIYYLAAPSRDLAEASPYYEVMKKRDIEVIFCYETYDEVVLMQLKQYNMRNIVSVEKEIRQSKDKVDFNAGSGLEKTQTNDLMDWMKTTLGSKCSSIKATPHLENHPCAITVEDMGAARHYIRTQFLHLPEETRYAVLQPQLEINPSHPIVLKLNSLRTTNKHLAKLIINQLFYNAMVTAGLIEDPRTVLTSMNELLILALEKH